MLRVTFCVSFAAVHIPCNCRVIVGAIIGSKLDKRVIVRELEIWQLSGFLSGSNFASQAKRKQTLSVERFAFYVRRGGQKRTQLYVLRWSRRNKNRESGELSECRGGQERTTNRTNFHEYCFLGGNVGNGQKR